MISAGNEDGNNWRKMLRFLKEACPIIEDQGCGGEVDTEGVVRPPFVFISDRDKGLKPHLRVPKLSTIVDTRIFYHIYWKNFRIPIFSSGILKFCSGLFI